MIKAGSKLPSGYQEVEYIESSGTQYIDTGVLGETNTKVDITISVTQLVTDAFYFGNSDNGNRRFYIGSGWNNTGFAFSYGGIIKQLNQININQKYNFVFESGTTTADLYKDGVLWNTISSTPSGTAYSIYLFARNVVGYASSKTKNKLYMCKIYKENILVRNFVPCYRKADNVIGLYDLVNNVFYTNQGDGTFEKGKKVLANIKTIKLHKDNNTNEIKYIKTRSNNLLKFHYDHSLPYTTKGIIFDEISEGIVNVTGEKTDSGYATLNIGWDRVTLKAGKTYVMGQNLTITCYKAADSSWYGNVSYVITPTEDLVTAGGYIATDQATPNFNAYVMLIEGDTKPNYYVPYMAKVFDQLPI